MISDYAATAIKNECDEEGLPYPAELCEFLMSRSVTWTELLSRRAPEVED